MRDSTYRIVDLARDPYRPTTRQEDFEQGETGAAEAFVDWLYESEYEAPVETICQLDDDMICDLVKKWSDSDV